MSKLLKVSAKARNDILQLGRYTENRWGQAQRNHYLKQLDDAFSLIVKNPDIGKDSSHVLSGYRSFQQGSHIIFYKTPVAIEIIRVLHERMDVEKHFQQS